MDLGGAISDLECIKQGKKAIASILEVLNLKFTSEVKKDPEREAKFLYSKFSPFADNINQKRKVLLKDILSLVQTNLLKMYVENKEKDKIYHFFQTNSKQMYIDAKDLDAHLQKGKDEPINNITMALLHEYSDNYQEALRIWSYLKTAEGCERTVSILRKVGKKDLITQYSRWVLEKDPKIGL